MKFRFIFIIFLAVTAINAGAQVDTLDIGGVTIIRDSDDTVVYNEKKPWLKKLNSSVRPRSIKTEWAIVDVGTSNFIDHTNYTGADAVAYAGNGINNEWLSLRPFKSRNINLWFVMQQVNVLRHVINFKYGLGMELNNYRYKQPVRYSAITEPVENPQVIRLDNTAGRSYKKNKLAADYLTVPVMLNINFTPYSLYSFEVSSGISVGYLYSSRNKTITSDEGKAKERGDFDLRPWKLSYVAEAKLGFITLYGSYAFKNMYTRGLDLTPYNAGIRLRPVEAFNKLETR